jgi:hypothetical protein
LWTKAGTDTAGSDDEDDDEEEIGVGQGSGSLMDISDDNIDSQTSPRTSRSRTLSTSNGLTDPGVLEMVPSTPHSSKKRKLQASLISKFIQPSFVMFESNTPEFVVDEYGASIDDLKFQDVTTMQIQK